MRSMDAIGTTNERRRGTALVSTLVVVSSLALFGMALLTTTLSGARTLNHQTDEFQLTSTVDSVALLSLEDLWADYVKDEGGAPGRGGGGHVPFLWRSTVFGGSGLGLWRE